MATAASLPAAVGNVRPHPKLRAPALEIWKQVAPELERLNLLRPSDGHAFSRYCETLVSYWEITSKLRMIGTTYETDSAHGKMRRISPEFAVQERLFNRLTAMEDRFGLNPASRQQIMLKLLGGQGHLPLGAPVPAADQPVATDVPPAGNPIGLLN